MGSDIIFRIAEISDLPKIVEIYNSTVHLHNVTADTEPVSVESKFQWFHEHLTEKRPLFMVEDQEGNVLGWLSFQSFYGRPAYDITAEISIYLSGNSRGKGIGKQILEFAEEKAKELGIENLLGFIFANNEPSIKLFKNFGFDEWGNLPEVAIIEGEKISLKILGKKIS